MSEPTTPAPDDEAVRLGISRELLDMLVCPVDHGRLAAESEGLRCTVCGRVFPVRDGIPSMVVEGQSA